MDERAFKDEMRLWAALPRIPGLTHEAVAAGLRSTGTLSGLMHASEAALETFGFSARARRLWRSPDWARIDTDIAWLTAAPDRHLVPLTSSFYPSLLANSGGAPPCLYVRGSPSMLANPQLAMVGSRSPTGSGRETAYRFAVQLATRGLTITSGLAEGIDAASHKGALSAPGATIAVCGTGLDTVYPAQNAALAEEIAMSGALVSEFPPGTPARRENFPRRNRLISGLSVGTLVVEAAKHSGSLITARLAGEQGREVFAIPGSIQNPLARGCHQLIRQGAKLVETVDDILSEWPLPLQAIEFKENIIDFAPRPSTTPPDVELDSDYRILLDALGFDPVDFSTLADRSGLKADALASMLLILELRGEVQTRPGGRYCRLQPN